MWFFQGWKKKFRSKTERIPMTLISWLGKTWSSKLYANYFLITRFYIFMYLYSAGAFLNMEAPVIFLNNLSYKYIQLLGFWGSHSNLSTFPVFKYASFSSTIHTSIYVLSCIFLYFVKVESIVISSLCYSISYILQIVPAISKICVYLSSKFLTWNFSLDNWFLRYETHFF